MHLEATWLAGGGTGKDVGGFVTCHYNTTTRLGNASAKGILVWPQIKLLFVLI